MLQAKHKAMVSTLLLGFLAPAIWADATHLKPADDERYIVVFHKHAANPRAQAAQLAAAHGATLGHTYTHAIKGFSGRIPAGRLQALLKHPLVNYIEVDGHAQAFAPTGVERINAIQNAVANINGVDERVDVGVAIIDTGIDPNHADLNVAGGKRFYSKGPRQFSDDNFADDNGHGTHVGGTVGALDNNNGPVGVAPGARLWAVKVLDHRGNGRYSDIIAGIDWVTANADKIEVANMSLGGGHSTALHDAIKNSVAAGVVYVVAAGNENQDIANVDPASYPEVATISALADSDGFPGGYGPETSYGPDDTLATFSNFSASTPANNPVTSPGGGIDLAMPGVDITSSAPGGGVDIMSGTSMASPHAAGLVALHIAVHGRAQNAAGVYAIRQALINASQPQINWRNGQDVAEKDNLPEGVGLAAPFGTVPPPSYNTAPVVTITSPAEGATFDSNTLINFTATATDAEDDDADLVVLWTSNRDGAITPGQSILSDGQHIITASATDSGGLTGQDALSITVGELSIATVASIGYRTEGGKNSDRHLLIDVTVLDANGLPVAGATVSISVTRDNAAFGNGTATTGSNGTVSFQSKNAPAGFYQTVVTSVTPNNGLIWDGLSPADPGFDK